jgi:hypothetical protein
MAQEEQKVKKRQYAREYYAKHRETIRKNAKEWFDKNRDRVNASKREYQKKHKKETKENYRKYRKENMQRLSCGHIASRKVPLGDHCEKCGATDKIERHHFDYTKPLEVTMLCHKCHRDLHNAGNAVINDGSNMGSEIRYYNGKYQVEVLKRGRIWHVKALESFVGGHVAKHRTFNVIAGQELDVYPSLLLLLKDNPNYHKRTSNPKP